MPVTTFHYALCISLVFVEVARYLELLFGYTLQGGIGELVAACIAVHHALLFAQYLAAAFSSGAEGAVLAHGLNIIAEIFLFGCHTDPSFAVRLLYICIIAHTPSIFHFIFVSFEKSALCTIYERNNCTIFLCWKLSCRNTSKP